MFESVRSILFALCLCVVCGGLLAAASTGLQERQKRNIMIDRQKNILKAVGLGDNEKKMTPSVIEDLYSKHIISIQVDNSGNSITESESKKNVGRTLPLYLYKKGNVIEGYIIPINSKGLWGDIEGYLALKNDGATISGFTVCRHAETPGLGGEIEQSWFQKNFVGKKITDMGGEFVSVAVAKGKAAERISPEQRINYVDGISGATLTGNYLTQGFREVLAEYEPVSVTFRNKKKYCLINKSVPWCKYEPEKK